MGWMICSAKRFRPSCLSVTLPFTAVPATLQPMVVLLVGAALGARLGAGAQAAYLMAGIIGLPVFAPSPLLPQGAARLIGPTGGYLMAYPLAAFVVGSLIERGWDRRYLTCALAMAAGLAVIYAGGLSWLTMGMQLSLAVAWAGGGAPFVLAVGRTGVLAARRWNSASSSRSASLKHGTTKVTREDVVSSAMHCR